jgi:hypothetical protein
MCSAFDCQTLFNTNKKTLRGHLRAGISFGVPQAYNGGRAEILPPIKVI